MYKEQVTKKKIVDTKLVKKKLLDASLTLERIAPAFDLDPRKLGRVIRNDTKRIPIEYASVLSRLCEDPETFREEVLSIERGERVSGLIDDYPNQ